ncbi:MAG: trehalase-like domain-containing protein, partial [Limisphaerales bacterium]
MIRQCASNTTGKAAFQDSVPQPGIKVILTLEPAVNLCNVTAMEEYQPIENYGIIGDLTTTALVSISGSIDFMCFPRFDSPTVFAALLDAKRGGTFRIAPAQGEFKNRQRYFPDTNILLTRYLGESGIAELSDFMAMQHLGHRHNLVRRVKVVRGEIEFEMVFSPKFDYGRGRHTIEKKPRQMVFIPDKKSVPA